VLVRANRLRSTSDISRVYKRGVYGGSSGVLSIKALRSGRPLSRAVIVVAKKISKRAVVRNHIRRRLSEILRSHWATVIPGYDIVISVHTDISELAPAALQDHLSKALKRVGIIQV
jgi:ribonuclease P protein component